MLCLCLMMISWGSKAWAQNNAYGIDDECYALFERAEALAGVSDQEFNLINDSLLHMALDKRDNKAQVLYYVERLKHVNRGSMDDEQRVLKAYEDASGDAGLCH